MTGSKIEESKGLTADDFQSARQKVPQKEREKMRKRRERGERLKACIPNVGKGSEKWGLRWYEQKKVRGKRSLMGTLG